MKQPKLVALLLTIYLSVVPQIAVAQTYEQLIQQGKNASTAGDFVKAEAIWREALRRKPKDPNVWVFLGRSLRIQDKLDEALTAYRKAIELNPQNPYAFNGLGNTLASQQNRLDEAIAAYRKAIQIDPINLSLTKLTRLSVNLPDPRKISSEDWLWGDLAVKNVYFEQSKQTGKNVNDEKYNSTIIKGQIRMGERELKVESNQFLLISKPGIKRLLNLEVIPPKPPQEINVQIAGETVEVSAPPEGLEVRLVGEADQIQVGLDRRFPVKSIKSSFLANFFSNDVLIAIISFFSAAVVSLLTWIVNDFLFWLSTNSQSAAKP